MRVKKAITGIMITLLLVSVGHFAAVNSVVRATGFKSDSSETEDWWRMFRHDLNHTGYSNSTVPIPLCELWNTRKIINGSVKSSPAIVDDKVFVGSSDKNVYVLNATTGYKIWNYTTKGAVKSSPAVVGDMVFVGSDDHSVYALNVTPPRKKEWNFTTGDAVRSSPAIANGMVFFGSLDNYTYALNTDGKLQWKFWTACPAYSSPAVSGGRVFIGASDGRVYALNMTGRYEWHFDTGLNCSSSPAVADGKVFVGSDNGNVYALNATNGYPIWSNSTGGPVKSSPAVAYGRVFIGSMNGNVYALNATTGNILWNFPTKGFVYSSPAVADGKVFAGSGDNRTYVLNATTGDQICNFTTGGPIYSSPAIAKNMVFIGSNDKKVYAFGAENKPPEPHIEVKPVEPFILQTVTFDGSESIDPDGRIVSCTWDFDDGTIIENIAWKEGEIVTHAFEAVRIYNVTLTVTDNHTIPHLCETKSTSKLVTVQEAWPMYRRDWNHTGYSTSLAPVTNDTIWEPKIGSDMTSDPWMYPSPAVVGDEIYIGCTNGTIGRVYAFYANKSLKWSTQLGGRVFSSPAVADGLVFIGSEDYLVYALNATTGIQVWNKTTTGPVYSSPIVVEGVVFIVSQTGDVYALEKTNGDQLWIRDTGGATHASPAVAGGKVFIGSAKGVYAWSTDGTDPWTYTTGKIFDSSPAVAYGIVFIGSNDGCVYALNTTGGSFSQIWKKEIGNKIKSSPAVADGKVFIGSDNGTVYAFDAITGHLEWKTPEPIGEVSWSSPAVADGKVFVGSADGVYALREEDGEEVWSYQTGGPFDSSPAILNDTLYVASKNGTLFAFWNKTHDIAIIEVIPPKSETIIVAQNGTARISVTVENQGSFNETNINITVYYFNTTDSLNVANSTVVTVLLRHNREDIELLWNTTGVAEGDYTISANATLTTDEDRADNYFIGGNVTIGGSRDINVTQVWLGCCNATEPTYPVKTVVGQDCSVNISITVKNEGNLTETNIKIDAYWSNSSHTNQTIDSYIIEELGANETKTVCILWDINATGVPLAKGNYTVSVYAWPLEGEKDKADNNFTDGWIIVAMVGDITGPDGWPDGKCDMRDIGLVARHFGQNVPPAPANCDITGPTSGVPDGKVDMRDIGLIARHFGEKDP